MQTDTEDQFARLTVRLPVSSLETLRAAAFAARLQPAVLARALLIGALEKGNLPAPAPPALSDLGPAAAKLFSVCLGLTSNFSQISEHSKRLGRPFDRLVEGDDGGLLSQLAERARTVGLRVKAGRLNETESMALLAALTAPSEYLNSSLARPLNAGHVPTPENWIAAIGPLRSALPSVSEHVL